MSNKSNIIKFKKIHSDAIFPTKHLNAACFDLYSIEDCFMSPQKPDCEVRTGIAFELPENYVGFIHTRSGMGFDGVRAHLGVIDPDFRGEITIRLFLYSKSKNTLEYSKGSRIAQIFFTEFPNIELLEVEELSESKRGVACHGSSGR